MSNALWQFTFDNTGKKTVPAITPVGVNGATSSQFLNGTTVVNVRDDFLWSGAKRVSLRGGREEVPYIVLKERRVKANSYITQLLYSAGVVGDAVTAAGALYQNKINGTPTTQAPLFDPIKGLSDLVKGTTDKIKSATGKDFSNVGSFIAENARSLQDDPDFLTDPWLQSYKGLYLTEPTGWAFFFPYFENDPQKNNANQWSDSQSSDAAGGQFLFEGIAKTATGVSELFGDLLGSFEIGTYQERTKFYQYQREGADIVVSFPLINTGDATYEDVVRNWQLIFLLMYNNRPERINRNLVEPPPLYEVIIPGVRYMPLSYISSLNIEYLGARRPMKITVPGTLGDDGEYQATEFKTIIPEAFKVNLTLKGMINDSKNLMYSTVASNSKVRVVDVSVFEQNIIQRNLREVTRNVLA